MEEDSKDKEDKTEGMIGERMGGAIVSNEERCHPIGNQARDQENEPERSQRLLPVLIWKDLALETPKDAIGAMQGGIEP